MAGLLAVAACEWIHALLGAVASTMSSLVADDTLNLGTFDDLGGLFFAMLLNMTELATVAALGDTAIEWHACTLFEAFDVLFGCSWPAFGEELALGIGAPVERQLELLVNSTGRADQREDISDFLLLSRC